MPTFARALAAGGAVLLLAAAPPGGSLSGTLGGAGVVWVSDGSQPPPTDGATLTQHDKTFVPELLVVNAGSTIEFRNDDTVDHSVYSVSAADPFDLGIYEPGPGKGVPFPQAGIVEVRCHIHRHMRATLVVVDGPSAHLERAGGWTLGGVRAGRHTLHLWTAEHGETDRAVEVR